MEAGVIPLSTRRHRLASARVFTGKGHKIWGWRLDQRSNKLGGTTMNVYLPSTTDGRTRRTHQWSLEQRGVPSAKQGLVCTVSDHDSGNVSIISLAEEAQVRQPMRDFWGVLKKWERTWMWENLQWIGDEDWLAVAIAEGTCIAVAD